MNVLSPPDLPTAARSPRDSRGRSKAVSRRPGDSGTTSAIPSDASPRPADSDNSAPRPDEPTPTASQRQDPRPRTPGRCPKAVRTDRVLVARAAPDRHRLTIASRRAHHGSIDPLDHAAALIAVAHEGPDRAETAISDGPDRWLRAVDQAVAERTVAHRRSRELNPDLGISRWRVGEPGHHRHRRGPAVRAPVRPRCCGADRRRARRCRCRRRGGGGLRDGGSAERLAAGSPARHSGDQVHDGPEVVTVTFDDGTVVQPAPVVRVSGVGHPCLRSAVCGDDDTVHRPK